MLMYGRAKKVHLHFRLRELMTRQGFFLGGPAHSWYPKERPRRERLMDSAMTLYDMLIIGSGPAGQKAAIQAAKLGKRVAIIEKSLQLGGTSLNTGTLPSKTLKDTIDYLDGFARRGFPQLGAEVKCRITLPDLIARKDQVITTEVAVVTDQLQRNHVEIIPGLASFVDPRTLQVARPDGSAVRMRGSSIVIATGSRPRRPETIPFDDITICDSDSILNTNKHPASITVMGGGVVGAEYASMLGVFGIHVTLIDRRTHLLRFIDHEIMRALDSHMQRNGVTCALARRSRKSSWTRMGAS